jgi:hypothetical protein
MSHHHTHMSHHHTHMSETYLGGTDMPEVCVSVTRNLLLRHKTQTLLTYCALPEVFDVAEAADAGRRHEHVHPRLALHILVRPKGVHCDPRRKKCLSLVLRGNVGIYKDTYKDTYQNTYEDTHKDTSQLAQVLRGASCYRIPARPLGIARARESSKTSCHGFSVVVRRTTTLTRRALTIRMI